MSPHSSSKTVIKTVVLLQKVSPFHCSLSTPFTVLFPHRENKSEVYFSVWEMLTHVVKCTVDYSLSIHCFMQVHSQGWPSKTHNLKVKYIYMYSYLNILSYIIYMYSYLNILSYIVISSDDLWPQLRFKLQWFA